MNTQTSTNNIQDYVPNDPFGRFALELLNGTIKKVNRLKKEIQQMSK